jgi:hypothetical protein
MSLEFVALSPLLLHCLRRSVAGWLTPAPAVFAPLDEVITLR